MARYGSLAHRRSQPTTQAYRELMTNAEKARQHGTNERSEPKEVADWKLDQLTADWLSNVERKQRRREAGT